MRRNDSTKNRSLACWRKLRRERRRRICSAN